MEDPPKHPEVAIIFTRLLSELGLSGNQLAKALNTSQQVISGYASGRTNPGREMIAAIIRRYPAINAAWLATGEGEPFPAGRYNQAPRPAPEPTPGLTSGAATVAEAENVLLRERLLDKQAIITLLSAEVTELRGKSSGSSDAAGRLHLPAPAPLPIVGFRLSVQHRTSRPGMQASR